MAALSLALVGAGATIAVVINALGRVAISLLLAMGGALVLVRLLPSLPFGRQLVLATNMRADLGYASPPAHDRSYLGQSGTALSPLRPAGIADIGGDRVDVVSDGGFIEPGRRIHVTHVDGNRVVVRQVPEQESSNE
jgi:membrane-bound serine protease (ClpP class)